MSARASAIVAAVAGMLLVASSGAHALGWPAVRQELRSAGASTDLIHTLAVGWTFGSVSMLAFGLIVLGAAAGLRRHARTQRAPLLVIGVAYLAFGLVAFLASGLNPHFVLFMATGVLVLIPAFGPA